jgi:hypothetical protein
MRHNRSNAPGLIVTILMAVVMIISSCKSEKSRSRDVGDLLDDTELSEVMVQIDQIRNVFYLTPSPAEMLGVIDFTDLQFDGSLPNDINNIDTYLDARSQALNLGIYITDLAYMALYGRHEETVEYLETVGNLANQVRVREALGSDLVERARKNVQSMDSLYEVCNEAFVGLLLYCEENRRANTAVLISAGAFIESLYLAVSLVEDFYEANYLIQHLADQKYVVDNLFLMAAGLSEDENVAVLFENLKPVKDLYDLVEQPEGNISLKKEESGKLVIGAKKQLGLSEEQFRELKKITSEIRSKIISNTA